MSRCAVMQIGLLVVLLAAGCASPPTVPSGPDRFQVHVCDLRGRMAESFALSVSDSSAAQISCSPDGRRMVLATPDGIFFLDGEGAVLNYWTGLTPILEHSPAFQPDGQAVVFCRQAVDPEDPEYTGKSILVWASPEGIPLAATAAPVRTGTLCSPAWPVRLQKGDECSPPKR